jgi:hypothetical protein
MDLAHGGILRECTVQIITISTQIIARACLITIIFHYQLVIIHVTAMNIKISQHVSACVHLSIALNLVKSGIRIDVNV